MTILNFCMAKETINRVNRKCSISCKRTAPQRPKRVNTYAIQRADKSTRRRQMTLWTNEQRIHTGKSQAIASKWPNRWEVAQTHCSKGKCKLKVMISCHFTPLNLGKLARPMTRLTGGMRRKMSFQLPGWKCTASGEMKLQKLKVHKLCDLVIQLLEPGPRETERKDVHVGGCPSSCCLLW